jgi:hypothetical protein
MVIPEPAGTRHLGPDAPPPLPPPIAEPVLSAGHGTQGAQRAAVVLVALAAALRLGAWTQERSLWIDEARLALNVASRSYLGLLQPLDYDQAAPPLFLWLQRLVVDTLGVSEATLRVVPLVSGLAVVMLAFPIGRRLYDDRTALLGVLLCALAPSLVSASTEGKQYGVEAAVTCLVLLSGLQWLEEPSRGRWYRVLGLGTAGVWLAPSIVFWLAALVAVVLMGGSGRRRVGDAVQAAACWGLSLAIAYSAVYAEAANAAYLQRYWSPAFLVPGRPAVLADGVAALRSVLWGPVFRDRFAGSDPLGNLVLIPGISLILALLLVIGARRLVRSASAPVATLVLLPPALTLVASALGIYPVSARTTLFYLPVLILLYAGAVEELSRGAVRRAIAAGVLLVPALLLLLVAVAELFGENPREHVRPLVAALERQRRPGEPVYVFAGAIPAWAFYTTDWQAPDTAKLEFLSGIASAGGAAFENAPSAGRRARAAPDILAFPSPAGTELYGLPTGIEATALRFTTTTPDPGWSRAEARRIRAVARPGVWILLAHFHGPEGELLHELEAAGGRRTFQDLRNGAALLRYDFSSRSD